MIGRISDCPMNLPFNMREKPIGVGIPRRASLKVAYSNLPTRMGGTWTLVSASSTGERSFPSASLTGGPSTNSFGRAPGEASTAAQQDRREPPSLYRGRTVHEE